MQLEILKNEEKRTNFIMFLFYASVPLVAFLYVLLFNGGAMKDSIAVTMVLAGMVVKLFEKQLGRYAKYFPGSQGLLQPDGYRHHAKWHQQLHALS